MDAMKSSSDKRNFGAASARFARIAAALAIAASVDLLSSEARAQQSPNDRGLLHFGDRGFTTFGDQPLTTFGNRPLTTFGDRKLTGFGNRGLTSFGDIPLAPMGGLPLGSPGTTQPAFNSGRISANSTTPGRIVGTLGGGRHAMTRAGVELGAGGHWARGSSRAHIGESARVAEVAGLSGLEPLRAQPLPRIEDPALRIDVKEPSARIDELLRSEEALARTRGDVELARALANARQR